MNSELNVYITYFYRSQSCGCSAKANTHLSSHMTIYIKIMQQSQSKYLLPSNIIEYSHLCIPNDRMMDTAHSLATVIIIINCHNIPITYGFYCAVWHNVNLYYDSWWLENQLRYNSTDCVQIHSGNMQLNQWLTSSIFIYQILSCVVLAAEMIAQLQMPYPKCTMFLHLAKY